MSGIVLVNEQHVFVCIPGKNAPFGSKRGKNPILACGCRKSAKFGAGFSSLTVNNVRSVGRLSIDRIVSGKVNALAKEGSNEGGAVSVIERDSQSRPSFFDEYVKAMESVKSIRDKKRAYDADRNSSNRVLSKGVGEDDVSLSRDNVQSTNRGDELLRNDAIRKGKFKGKETRAYEKVKVVSKGGTGKKEKQNLGRYSNGQGVDKYASNKVLVHEAVKDNHEVGREIVSKGWGDKLVQNSVWKRREKPESKENRVDGEAKRVSKDESVRKERRVLGKDFKGRDPVVDRQQTSAAKHVSIRKDRQVLGRDFNGRNAVVHRQQTSAANDQSSKDRYAGERKPYAGKRSSGQDRHVDPQWADTARYGNEKNNVKLLGNGVREGKVVVNGYASEQGFRNKKKVWQLEDDDTGFEIDRAAFRTSVVPGDIVDKPKPSRKEMEERIQKLAKGLNGADIEMPEWMFSQMMRSAKIKFCDHSIMRVIQILGKLGNWRRVLQVIEWIQVRERYKSHKLRYIYNAAVDAMGKARRPVEALNLFQTMQKQMSSYPDIVAYHSIAVTLGQAGHMRELFDVIDVMRSPPKSIKTSKLLEWDPRLEPDLLVYNAVLNACVKRKQWEGAFWVLQQLEQTGQQPSSTTYGLVMEVMLACEKYNLVHELFRKVQKSGIPSALTYKVLVNTLWREGKTDEAVSAVQEMEQRGIVGSAALYYDLARCLCSAGRCQEALLLMEKICKVANKPLVVTYTGLIQTCLDCREIQNAALIFKEMEKFCSPNLVTCNIMINAYIKHGMFEEARDLFNKMLEDRDYITSKADYKTHVLPDTYTFNTMLDASFEGKKWDDLEFIFQKMLDHGYHFNVNRHLRIVLESSRAGKTGPLETTWNYFVRADRIPPPALMKEYFCTKLEERDYAAALSSIFSGTGSDGPGFSMHAWSKLLRENIRRFRRDGIEGLVNEVEFRLPSGSAPNPELETLLVSCKKILGIRS